MGNENTETISGGGPQTGGELGEGQDPQMGSQPTTETMLSHTDGQEETKDLSQQAPAEAPKVFLGQFGERLGPKGERNIRLSSKKENEALPEGTVNVGMESFEMPTKEAQLAGFWVDSPGTFIAQFRQYKFNVDKGEKTPPVNIQ